MDDVFYESSKRLIQQIDNGGLRAICSSIVFGEVVYTSRDNESLAAVEAFFERLAGYTDLPADRTICRKAAELRQKYTALKLPDAIHLATALTANVDEFITADKLLSRIAGKEIKTWLLGT